MQSPDDTCLYWFNWQIFKLTLVVFLTVHKNIFLQILTNALVILVLTEERVQTRLMDTFAAAKLATQAYTAKLVSTKHDLHLLLQ